MEFSLYYRGELKSNQSSNVKEHKHQLRQRFHSQLKELWTQNPLNEFKQYLLVSSDAKPYHPAEGNLSILHPKSGFIYAPLVSSRIHLIAELDILILRQDEPGKIITQGGDIDNRLKTLLDSLKIPDANALPENVIPQADEQPFYCLLEDDNLVTRISVRTERLLEETSSRSEVILLIHVKTKQLKVLVGTLGFP